MKPIKKFSTISNGATKSADSILESANLSPEALAELVQKLGYNNIDEVKKEKALLSKLEALLKEFTPKDDVSEDDAEDIENEIVAMGEPKSLEDEEGEKEEDKEAGAEGEVAESDDEDTSDEIEKDTVEMGEPKEEPESKGDEVVTDEQPITDEVPAEGDDGEAGKDVEVEEESEEKPVAKRRIMTFEDFCTEKEETINKNISYRDDEEEEDYAVPVAEEDGEDKEEEIEHDKDAAKDDYAHIEDLKKDAADDKEEEDKLEEESFNHSTSGIKSFSQFVSEGYEVEEEEDSEEEEVTEEADNGPELKEETPDDNGIALKIAKGDGPETAAGIAGDIMAMGKVKKEDEKDGEALVTKDQPITKAPETSKDEPNVQGTVVVKEKFTFADAVDTAGEDVKANEKGIASALKALKAKGANDISIMTDTTEDGGLYDAIKKMKTLPINSTVYDRAYVGKYKGKDVVVFDGGEDLFAYVKESAVTEKEIKSDAEFEEYATAILKQAHGDKFDEAKAKEVIDGLKSKYSGDYGAMVGALQSSMGESVTFNEAKNTNFKEELNEAQIPSNIEKFAKERGVLRDVKQIASWAEKAGKRIYGGHTLTTGIGKGYDTLVLDLTPQGEEVYFYTDKGTIKVNRQPVTDWKSFSKAVSESVNEAKNTNFKVGDLVWVDGMFLPKDIKWEIVNISDVKSGETEYSLRSALNPKVTTVIYGGDQLKAWDKPGNGMKPKGSGSYIK